jgi:transposase InsO family protein
VSRYRCVDDQKAAGFPVQAACQAAGVSTSAYYEWREREAAGPTAREREEQELIGVIHQIHGEFDGTYGAPRMTAEVRRRGRNVNHKRVERLMARLGLVGHRPRRRRNLTVADRAAAPVPDLIGGVFSLPRPDVGWVGDITYIPTGEGWLYLASVLDLASRRVVGWSMGQRHDAALVTDALRAAVATRGRARMDRTIFHSDRGGEYTASDFARACQALGVRRSVGRTGICFDNAAAESFFASLKVERVNRRCYATRAEARVDVFAWINRYNTRRLHSAIGYMPPVEWEHHHQRDRDHLGSTRAA